MVFIGQLLLNLIVQVKRCVMLTVLLENFEIQQWGSKTRVGYDMIDRQRGAFHRLSFAASDESALWNGLIIKESEKVSLPRPVINEEVGTGQLSHNCSAQQESTSSFENNYSSFEPFFSKRICEMVRNAITYLQQQWNTFQRNWEYVCCSWPRPLSFLTLLITFTQV